MKPIKLPPPTKRPPYYPTQAEMNRHRDEMHRRLGTPLGDLSEDVYDVGEDRGLVMNPRKGRKGREKGTKAPEQRRGPLPPVVIALAQQVTDGEVRHRAPLTDKQRGAK